MLGQIAREGWFWGAFGVLGTVIFFSRFYVQWAVSEYKGRYVVPPLFWYQSAVGSLMLLVWSWHTQSPIGALSQSVNLVPYARNLVHIWRERGEHPKWWYHAVHAFVALVVTAALAVVLVTWWREVLHTRTVSTEEAQQTWFWLAIGVLGTALFGLRVLVQWVITERRRKSVVPPSFWYISIVASALQFLTFASRGGGEWLFAAGVAATVVIYARNLWFIHTGRGEEAVKG